MTEIDYKRSEMSTLGEIAEGLKLTAQTVKRHVEAAGLEPVWKVGGANLYVIAQVTEILAKRGHGKEVGYIHPDQHREVVERAQLLAIENIALQEEIDRLMYIVDRMRNHPALDDMGSKEWKDYGVTFGDDDE